MRLSPAIGETRLNWGASDWADQTRRCCTRLPPTAARIATPTGIASAAPSALIPRRPARV